MTREFTTTAKNIHRKQKRADVIEDVGRPFEWPGLQGRDLINRRSPWFSCCFIHHKSSRLSVRTVRSSFVVPRNSKSRDEKKEWHYWRCGDNAVAAVASVLNEIPGWFVLLAISHGSRLYWGLPMSAFSSDRHPEGWAISFLFCCFFFFFCHGGKWPSRIMTIRRGCLYPAILRGCLMSIVMYGHRVQQDRSPSDFQLRYSLWWVFNGESISMHLSDITQIEPISSKFKLLIESATKRMPLHRRTHGAIDLLVRLSGKRKTPNWPATGFDEQTAVPLNHSPTAYRPYFGLRMVAGSPTIVIQMSSTMPDGCTIMRCSTAVFDGTSPSKAEKENQKENQLSGVANRS